MKRPLLFVMGPLYVLAGVAHFAAPDAFERVVPPGFPRPRELVYASGLAEIAFGLALLFGLLTRATAAGAFVLFTLTLFGLPDDPVLAHITMFGLASAVFTLGGGPLSIDAWLARDADQAPGGTAATAD